MATLLTADEFLAAPKSDHVRQELVRGEVRDVTPAGGWHGTVGANLYDALMPFVRARRLGRCFYDGTGFLLPLPPELRRRDAQGEARDTVRSPDVAFVRRDRVPAGGFGPGWVPLAPDLAVEVLSPNETASDTQEKLADYRAAGTELLWVVDPARRIVTVHAADAPTRWLREGDVLEGGSVVPGFALAVEALFEDVAAG
jgi:Uma2 family endonuclease